MNAPEFPTSLAGSSQVDAEMPSADAAQRAVLSALADGEAAALERGCALWRDDPAARATWHAYHVIGDVMRSDDMAGRPQRDAAFLAALRQRLAAEPAVLAPAPVPALVAQRRTRGPRWMMPAAVAAGFMAVAGVLVLTRMVAAGGDGPVLASGQPSVGGFITTAVVPASGPRPLVVEGRLIRDARLDSYLHAHRAALGGVPSAVPGGALRSVDTPISAPAPQAQR